MWTIAIRITIYNSTHTYVAMCYTQPQLPMVSGQNYVKLHTGYKIYTHCGSCVMLLILPVVCFTDEALDKWCTVVDLLHGWLSVLVVLTVLTWVAVNSIVMAGTGGVLKVSKISVYNYETCHERSYVHIIYTHIHT